MEHRCSKRVAKAVPVMIYRYGLPEVVGATRDIGSGGMFVCVGETEYKQNPIVDIEIPNDAGERNPIRMRAMIIRIEEDGLAITFNGEPATRKDLFHIIDSYKA